MHQAKAEFLPAHSKRKTRVRQPRVELLQRNTSSHSDYFHQLASDKEPASRLIPHQNDVLLQEHQKDRSQGAISRHPSKRKPCTCFVCVHLK